MGRRQQHPPAVPTPEGRWLTPPRDQYDPKHSERHYGDITLAESRLIDANRCVVPCNSAVCPVYGTWEMINSDGAIRRADGRRAFCEGCMVERSVACARKTCGHRCNECQIPYNVTDPERIERDSIPAVCGQKHTAPLVELAEVGGFETEDCDRPWIPPRRMPFDQFVCGIQPMKGYVETAHRITGQRSWITNIQNIWPSKPKNIRERFGVPDDHFFALNFRVKDKLLEDIWHERHELFDYLARQDAFDLVFSVNFSPWGDLPRFNALLMAKRMFISYAEMIDRGIPCAFEYEMGGPRHFRKYLEDFRVRNGINAVHTNYQHEESPYAKVVKDTIFGWDPRSVMVFASGAAAPRAALKQIAVFRHQAMFFSNMDVLVRAGHWKVPPGHKISRKKMSKPEIFAEGVRRWQVWVDKLRPEGLQEPTWVGSV